jgi:tetratricopeptide (TPR) repeat protein
MPMAAELAQVRETANPPPALAKIAAQIASPLLANADARQRKVLGLLKSALKLHKRGQYGEAAKTAAEAADLDPASVTAYYLIAASLEHVGQTQMALKMYEKAAAIDPNDPDLYLNIGLSAFRMGMHEQAGKAFQLYISMRPDCHRGYNNMGTLLREQGRIDEAVEVIRGALYRMPECADLWNALGAAVSENSDWPNAVTFYNEALRLEPKSGRFWHNLGYAYLHTGPLDHAVACFDKALTLNQDAADEGNIQYARCLALLILGRLPEAWRHFHRRLEIAANGQVTYVSRAPEWRREPLLDKTILVVGEQGLGDEIMFAEAIPDLLEQTGPGGKVIVACEHRLVPLFRRSFPDAIVGPQLNSKTGAKRMRVVPWAEADHKIDYHCPIGTVLPHLRPAVSDFGRNGAFLKPCPEKTAHWTARLAALGPALKVGVCWRSMMITTQRRKFYGPLELWATPLKTAGVKVINFQYGDCTAEIEEARDKYGLEIVNFPDIDLKNDLDGAAALAAALDLVVSAPTAAAALSAAIGTETWFLTARPAWPQLGLDHYPWYPKTRVVTTDEFGDWPAIMDKLTVALVERAAR